jgi:hypothetical protein
VVKESSGQGNHTPSILRQSQKSCNDLLSAHPKKCSYALVDMTIRWPANTGDRASPKRAATKWHSLRRWPPLPQRGPGLDAHATGPRWQCPPHAATHPRPPLRHHLAHLLHGTRFRKLLKTSCRSHPWNETKFNNSIQHWLITPAEQRLRQHVKHSYRTPDHLITTDNSSNP